MPSGGAKRAVYEWTRRLVTNHQVDVYTLSSADHDFCDLRPFVQQYRVFEFTEQRLFNSPFGRLNQLQRWRDLGNLVEIGRHIANEINTGQYDVVFANGCFYTFIPAFLQFIELPAVYYLHEPFRQSPMHLLKRPYLSNNGWRNSLNRFDPLIKLYQQRLEAIRHKSIKQTRCFLSNSQFTRRQIKMDYAVDAPVCYLGVDVEKFQSLPVEREDNIIMSVGELSPRKGFDFLIESLAYIPLSKRPKLKIVCNNIVPLEKEYIQRLAVQRRVDLQILTNLNTDDLALEYNKAQFCVYAPVSEPFGLVP